MILISYCFTFLYELNFLLLQLPLQQNELNDYLPQRVVVVKTMQSTRDRDARECCNYHSSNIALSFFLSTFAYSIRQPNAFLFVSISPNLLLRLIN